MEKNDIYSFIYTIKEIIMILTKEIKIKIRKDTICYYREKGYDVDNSNIITINPIDLSEGSHFLIEVKCDVCGIEKELQYRLYNKSMKNDNFYACSKCRNEKAKSFCLKKYGVEFSNQSENNKLKSRQTCLEKYGVEYSSQNKESKLKYKKTCLERYGVEHYLQSNDKKEKTKQTYLKKYGIENYVNIEKIKETKLKRYDNEYYNNPDKVKKTVLKNYGVENVSQSEEIKNIKEQKMIERGFHTNGNNRTEFQKYRSEVTKYTNRNKKILFKNWDGYDFYDNEYIKDNFNLSSKNGKHPTIDHKISVFYGFENNISPEEISKLDNLCITKKSINSKKFNKCEI